MRGNNNKVNNGKLGIDSTESVLLIMLTCVCRPVSSSFVDKQSIMGAPIDRDQLVVTSEPTKAKVGTAKPIVNPQVIH